MACEVVLCPGSHLPRRPGGSGGPSAPQFSAPPPSSLWLPSPSQQGGLLHPLPESSSSYAARNPGGSIVPHRRTRWPRSQRLQSRSGLLAGEHGTASKLSGPQFPRLSHGSESSDPAGLRELTLVGCRASRAAHHRPMLGHRFCRRHSCLCPGSSRTRQDVRVLSPPGLCPQPGGRCPQPQRLSCRPSLSLGLQGTTASCKSPACC